MYSCTPKQVNNNALQTRVDSLEKKLTDSYRPGLGEFMMGVQAHHSKLWFAGHNQNWKLADFELNEIKELIEDIQKYETDRPEAPQTVMLQPALDSINSAIQTKDPVRFHKSFVLLTNTCNNCHHAVKFEFNVVKIPDSSPYTNQDFKAND